MSDDTYVPDYIRMQDENSQLSGPVKIPPQSVDIERAVIGALLLEKNSLTRVGELLKPEMFYRDDHRAIYETIVDLAINSQPYDVMIVLEAMKKKSLYSMDITNTMMDCTSLVSSAANLEFHARIIAEKWMLREIIGIGTRVVSKGYDTSSDVFELLEEVEKSFIDMRSAIFKKRERTAKEIYINSLNEIEKRQKLYEDGKIIGVPSGYYEVDAKTTGYQKGDLIILAARPSMGKTAFMLQNARNAAIDYGKNILIYSLEMSEQQLMDRFIAAESGVDMQDIRRGNLTEDDWRLLQSNGTRIATDRIIVEDTPGIEIFELRSKSKRIAKERKLDMIMVDYIQLVTVGSRYKRVQNREQEIAFISKQLKELAKELDIPVMALSQLSRAVETRSDKIPKLSDLRESGSIEQDADMVMFLYRPEYYGFKKDEDNNDLTGICQAICQKQRQGPLFEVDLGFVGKYGRFYNKEDFDRLRGHESSVYLTPGSAGFDEDDGNLFTGGNQENDLPF